MSTALHLCGPDDLTRLADLMTRSAEELGHADPQARIEAAAPLLEHSQHGMAYLLGPTRGPVGYVLLSIGWSMAAGGLAATVEDIFVRPSIRNRGIATEVLRALSTRLREAGVRGMALTLPADAPTGLPRHAGLTACPGVGFFTPL